MQTRCVTCMLLLHFAGARRTASIGAQRSTTRVRHNTLLSSSSIITGTICTCPFPVFVPTSNCSSFALLSSGVGVTVVWLCSGATGTLLRPSRTRTLAAAGAGPESGQTSQDWCFAYYLASSLDIQALTENWKALLPLTPVLAALREGLA